MNENTDPEYRFKKLKQRPDVAKPTIFLMTICLGAIAFSWNFCLNGTFPLWVGCIVNAFAMYFLFSPIHDAMHQAVFKKKLFNNLFLGICLLPILPLSTGQFLRMMHMQHHRFVNDQLDPDHYLSKNWKKNMHLWPFWGFRYLWFYKQNKTSLPRYSIWRIRYDYFIIFLVLVPLFFVCPIEMLFLWLFPVLIMKWLVCAVFMFLPHYPHDIKQKENPYQATLIRKGWEWLLTPLLAYQNYHLVHHLYPTVPFYRYKDIWAAREAYHQSFNPAEVDAFSLKRKHVLVLN